MTTFVRIRDAAVDEKAEALRAAIVRVRSPEQPSTVEGVVFERDPSMFLIVPGAPFAYWVSDAVRETFQRFERVEGKGRTVKQGLATADDFRFVRLYWEVAATGLNREWRSFAKGGAFSPLYADVPLVLEWRAKGAILKAKVIAEHGNVGKRIYNEDFFGRSGLTWPLRTNGLSFRAMPAGCVFGHKGPAAFVAGDSSDELLALGAIANSQIFGYVVAVQLARTELAQSYEVGLIQQTPIPNLSEESTTVLAQIARRAWSLKRALDTSNETSHAFLLPPGVNEKVTGLDAASVQRELADSQGQSDDLAFALYGISAEDRATIEAPTRAATSASDDVDAEAPDDANEGDDETAVGGGSEALGSWLVGVAFGRFDPRLATGDRAIPSEPEPFDPLPSRSPGMYPEGEEPAGRPGILVDDEGHPDDLAARAIAVAERVKVDAPENLRDWLAKEFFPFHIKMYSKSRRKAPIYWQLATPSAGYSVWLYLHAFSNDTLFRVQNDYLAPRLAHEERRLDALARELRDGGTAAQRKALAAQEAFVEELRAFLDDVKRVAPLWNPDLDDGVIINFALLWRLVPQHKAWQKELKATWEALYGGEYDWSHLAMHLWPERVVPKCATDRSFAIAHGLEEVFWVEGSDGKWTARKTPTRPIEELVRERSSAAVKAALKSLVEAAPLTGSNGARKGGRRRGATAALREET